MMNLKISNKIQIKTQKINLTKVNQIKAKIIFKVQMKKTIYKCLIYKMMKKMKNLNKLIKTKIMPKLYQICKNLRI